MNRLKLKRKRMARRVRSVRKNTVPKTERLRLVINRSNKNLRVQIIDDVKKVTLCAAGTDEKSFGGQSRNKDAAKKLGELLAERALAKGIKQVYMDRRGVLYHGRLAAFADAAREKGLEF